MQIIVSGSFFCCCCSLPTFFGKINLLIKYLFVLQPQAAYTFRSIKLIPLWPAAHKKRGLFAKEGIIIANSNAFLPF